MGEMHTGTSRWQRTSAEAFRLGLVTEETPEKVSKPGELLEKVTLLPQPADL